MNTIEELQAVFNQKLLALGQLRIQFLMAEQTLIKELAELEKQATALPQPAKEAEKE